MAVPLSMLLGMPRKSARALWADHLSGKSGSVAGPRASVPPLGARPPYHGVVLGVDPSLRGTGLAVVAFAGQEQVRLLTSQVVRIHTRESMPTCLAEIFRTMTGLLESWQIRHVAVEETIFVQNYQTAQRLGAARGAVLTAAAIRGIPVFEYPPLRIKQAVCGFGRASKEQMIRQVSGLLMLKEHLPTDAADAVGAALCHAQNYNSAIAEL